jgi:site-specific DNA-cytosine methylase
VSRATMADVRRAEGTNGMTGAVLFGGGGFGSLGDRLAGYRVGFANEWDPVAADTYELNASGLWVDRRDVALVTGDDLLRAVGGTLHYLTGSPPCQDLSRAGRGDLGGENMARYYEAVRLVGEALPWAFAFENVAALVEDPAYGRHFVPIRDRLVGYGYRVAVRVLDTSRYGCAQARRRAIVIGVRSDLGVRARDAFPRLGPVCAIQDVLPDVNRFVRLGQRVRDVRHFRHRAEDLVWPGSGPGPALTTSGFSVYGRSRLRADTAAGLRRVTVEDAMAMCGVPVGFEFPEGTSEAAMWRMLGNGWPTPAAEAVGRSVAQLLVSCRRPLSAR